MSSAYADVSASTSPDSMQACSMLSRSDCGSGCILPKIPIWGWSEKLAYLYSGVRAQDCGLKLCRLVPSADRMLFVDIQFLLASEARGRSGNRGQLPLATMWTRADEGSERKGI